MISFKNLNIILVLLVSSTLLISCGGKIPGADARKYPKDPEKRIAKNMEEGKGFRLLGGDKSTGGVFEFASSNELWRASLDTIDFMPLLSVDYGGGIIITDWYGEENENDAIKITIQFLSNEVRSDALNIKVFNKKCVTQLNCVTSEKEGAIKNELKTKIIKTASIYEKENKDKKKK